MNGLGDDFFRKDSNAPEFDMMHRDFGIFRVKSSFENDESGNDEQSANSGERSGEEVRDGEPAISKSDLELVMEMQEIAQNLGLEPGVENLIYEDDEKESILKKRSEIASLLPASSGTSATQISDTASATKQSSYNAQDEFPPPPPASGVYDSGYSQQQRPTTAPYLPPLPPEYNQLYQPAHPQQSYQHRQQQRASFRPPPNKRKRNNDEKKVEEKYPKKRRKVERRRRRRRKKKKKKEKSHPPQVMINPSNANVLPPGWPLLPPPPRPFVGKNFYSTTPTKLLVNVPQVGNMYEKDIFPIGCGNASNYEKICVLSNNSNLFKQLTGSKEEVRDVDLEKGLKDAIQSLDKKGKEFTLTKRQKPGRHQRQGNKKYQNRRKKNGSFGQNCNNKGDEWMDEDCSNVMGRDGEPWINSVNFLKRQKMKQLELVRSLKNEKLVLSPDNQNVFLENLDKVLKDLRFFCEGYSTTDILSNVCVYKRNHNYHNWKPLGEMNKDIFGKMNLNEEGEFNVEEYMVFAKEDERAKNFEKLGRNDIEFLFRSGIFAFRARDPKLKKLVGEVMKMWKKCSI